jgi:hypothetical protein
MFMVEHPPLKAEDRPRLRPHLPMIDAFIRRPKDIPEQQPGPHGPDLIGDPVFALRREAFEQYLTIRKEALERRYAEREAELEKAFAAKVKKAVEAEMVRIGKRVTNTEWLKLAGYFHLDKRSKMTERDWDRAFDSFMRVRDKIVVKAKGKPKADAAPAAPDPAPEPPQEEPPAGALS